MKYSLYYSSGSRINKFADRIGDEPLNIYGYVTGPYFSPPHPLPFLHSIGGMSLIVGEVFQFSRVEVRRQDRKKCAIIAALVCWYLAIVIFAVPALYYFTFQQVV